MKSPLLLFSLCVVLFVCYSPCVLLSLCVTLLVCWSPCEVHNKTPFLCKSRFRLVVLSSKTSTFKCMISNLHPERHYGNCLEQTCIGRLKTSMVLRQKSWTDLHRTLNNKFASLYMYIEPETYLKPKLCGLLLPPQTYTRNHTHPAPQISETIHGIPAPPRTPKMTRK